MAISVTDNLSFFWQPKTDAQRAALESDVEFLLFGGAAGSLKSETLLINAIKYRDNRHMSSVIFRKTFPELEQLIRRSRDIYSQLGAKYNEQKKLWVFPSNGTVRFAFCERDDDIVKQYGAEYNFIGWDESTHFTEYPIRFMFSRLRSKDPFLQEHLRVHLATNPGNAGHIWHKTMFLGPVCTHCRIIPNISRLPGRVYRDAVWPSDGRRVGKTTAFIPGRLSDHSLLGDDYAKQLDALPAYLSKALKEGCWDVFAGQYFDCWDANRMVVDRRKVHEEAKWWMPHWVGIDYGFNVSQATAYLFCKLPESAEYPNGRIIVRDEFTAKHMTAAEFAVEMKNRFHVGERRIFAHYLSPDAFAKRGDSHCLADQMTEATNITFERASDDRVGGAMMVYTMLDSGECIISEDCFELKEAIPSRVHDPRKPDDVLKVAGEKYDDDYDAFRYGMYSYIRTVDKPRSIIMEEAMYSSDPTSAMIQRRLAEAKLQKSDSPIFYSNFRRFDNIQ